MRPWSEWAGVAPGALQGDLVLHCGETRAGFYLSTLCVVDIASSWTELEAVGGLVHQRVAGRVHDLSARLPMPVRHWHADNGSEFLNRSLLAWCRQRGVQGSWGRSYRKNDQARVEQKNGPVSVAIQRALEQLWTLAERFPRAAAAPVSVTVVLRHPLALR